MSLNIKNGDQLIPVAGTPKVTKSSLELDKVENKTSAEIRDELTLDNVKNAMGDAYLDKTELLSFENDVYNRTGGGKNLLDLSTVSESTDRGVTFTPVYVDGVVDHILINGENDGTAESVYRFKSGGNAWGNNIVSFRCDDSNVRLLIGYYDASWGWKKNQTVYDGNEAVISSDQPLIQAVLYISKGASLNNAKAYIMVRPPHIKSNEYVPYIPTNSELNTELKTNLLSTIVASSNASASNAKTLEFQGTGKNLEKLVIDGKTSQDGTPSPSAPVEIKGVGISAFEIGAIGTDGTLQPVTSAQRQRTDFIDFKAGTHKLTWNDSNIELLIYQYTTSGTFVKRISSGWEVSGNSFTLSDKAKIKFMLRDTRDTDFTAPSIRVSGASDFSINYKIPISVAGKTSNIYLDQPLFDGEILDTEAGTVDKKYYYTTFSNCNWQYNTDNSFFWVDLPNKYSIVENTLVSCSSYTGGGVKLNAEMKTAATGIYHNNISSIKIKDTRFTTVEDFIAAMGNAQFKYKLATPTKETFDAPEIATTVGKNALTVGTDVTPASISVTSFGEYYSKAEVDKMLKDKDTGWIKADGADANVSSESDIRYRVINNVIYVRGTFKLTSIPSSKTIVLATTPYKPELSAVEYICSMDSNYSFNMAGRVLFQASSGRVILQFSSTDKTPLVNTEYSLPMLVVPM